LIFGLSDVTTAENENGGISQRKTSLSSSAENRDRKVAWCFQSGSGDFDVFRTQYVIVRVCYQLE